MELGVRFSVALSGTILSVFLLQHECKKLEGYKFPVYSTEFCPRNETEWNERSSAINCTKDNGYLCFPNEHFTLLLEFCHTSPFIWIEEGYCLYLKKSGSSLYSYNCSGFQSGCHNSSIPSNKLYEYPGCTSIGNGCFLAEPFCEVVTTTFQTETSEHDNNSALKDNGGLLLFVTTLGIFLPICVLFLLIIISKKGNQFCIRCEDVEHHLEQVSEQNPSILPDKGDNRRLIVQEEEEEEEEEHSPLIKTNQRDKTERITKELPLDRALFEHWKEEDQKFVSTRACKEVEKLINNKNLIIVTGTSGSGKSAIIQHIALCYRSQGWTVNPICEVKEIMDAYSSVDVTQNKTIFVFNDPIGNESFDEMAYESWRKQEERLKVCLKKNKILLSCRKHILNDPRVKGILIDKSCIVDISSDQLKLDIDEKQKIWTSHSSNDNLSKEEIDVISQTEEYFPLLCKLYLGSNMERKEKLRFFKEPVAEFEKEISNFTSSDKEKYCTLLLLVMFNGELCLEDIDVNENAKEKYKLALDQCGLRDTPKHVIKATLKTLEGFFFKVIGDYYHFYHDFIMEVTTYMIGKEYPLITIEYADIGFIRRRVICECLKDTDSQFTVYLSDKYINHFVKRLVKELIGDHFLDVVLYPGLKTENLIQRLIEELKLHPEKLKMLLKKKELEIEKEEQYQETKHLFLSKLAFLGLENQISPLYALIAFSHTRLSLYCIEALEKQQENVKDISLFSTVCCNGSLELFNTFSKNEITKFLTEKWGYLFPVHIVSVFHNHEMLKKLIELKVELNLRDESKSGFTPLMYAAGNDTKENDKILSDSQRNKTVKLLLNTGANVNLCSKYGSSPLFLACFDGYNKTVQLLLENKAKINLCKKDGTSPLYIACAHGHDSTVQLLMSYGAEVNLCDNDGTSPLYIACQIGHGSTVQLLLSKGANVNLCDKDGTSPLYIASVNGHDSSVQLLLSNGAEVNLCDNYGDSPLRIACLNEHESIVQLLLSKGANVNLCDKDGTSPLYIASVNGHDSSVQLLLSNGAEVNLCDNDGTSPLHKACQNGHDSSVQLLLSNGAEVNLCDDDGTSPLYKACQNGHDSSVKILLSNGANVNLCDDFGTSPLSIACQNGHDSTVQLLLKNGATVNLCNNVGTSPLFEACINQHISTVQLLLSNGADINLCDNYGDSPLRIACLNEHESIVQLLLSNGADVSLCDKNGFSHL